MSENLSTFDNICKKEDRDDKKEETTKSIQTKHKSLKPHKQTIKKNTNKPMRTP